LLNFLLPDVFASSTVFDSWFDVSAADGKDDAAKTSMVRQLHRVLRPFMLRRLKIDVAKSLPPKSETILYCGMTALQRDVYKSVLMRNMDAVLSTGKGSSEGGKSRMANLLMHLRKAVNHPYLFDGVEDRSLDPLGEHVITSCYKLQL
jgi:SWI/SNF-related matrix-associated actin-dependent regulator of chromatin subfamily A member 5